MKLLEAWEQVVVEPVVEAEVVLLEKAKSSVGDRWMSRAVEVPPVSASEHAQMHSLVLDTALVVGLNQRSVVAVVLPGHIGISELDCEVRKTFSR